MGIQLYSTNCPKCKVVETLLNRAEAVFDIIDDVDKVVAFGEEQGITTAPILVVDDKILDFSDAVKYIKETLL